MLCFGVGWVVVVMLPGPDICLLLTVHADGKVEQERL